MDHIVGHLDIDYFYAQVEEVINPELKSKPVLVCVFSGRTDESGVVSTSNYVARKYGVKSGMPIKVAKKLLMNVDAKFLPARIDKYNEYSSKVMNVLKNFSDSVRQTSIDEAYFDITHKSEFNFEKAKEICRQIKERILESTNLTASIGVGPTHVIAKIASDLCKPNGLLVISKDEAKEFVSSLAIEKLPGIGSKTAQVLHKIGITKLGEISRYDPSLLYSKIGKKLARNLYNTINLADEESIARQVSKGQLSRIITLPMNTRDPTVVSEHLNRLIYDLQMKLDQAHLVFRTITFTAIYTDLSIKTKSKTLTQYVRTLSEIRPKLMELILDVCLSSQKEIRRVGIKVSDLCESRNQASLADYFSAQ